MMRLESCCYRCVECGLTVCADDFPSPTELGNVCADCFDASGAEVPC